MPSPWPQTLRGYVSFLSQAGEKPTSTHTSLLCTSIYFYFHVYMIWHTSSREEARMVNSEAYGGLCSFACVRGRWERPFGKNRKFKISFTSSCVAHSCQSIPHKKPPAFPRIISKFLHQKNSRTRRILVFAFCDLGLSGFGFRVSL